MSDRFLVRLLLRVLSDSFVQAAWLENIQRITEKYRFRQQYVPLCVQATKSLCYITYSDNSAFLVPMSRPFFLRAWKLQVFGTCDLWKNFDRLPLRRFVSLSFHFFWVTFTRPSISATFSSREPKKVFPMRATVLSLTNDKVFSVFSPYLASGL